MSGDDVVEANLSGVHVGALAVVAIEVTVGVVADPLADVGFVGREGLVVFHAYSVAHVGPHVNTYGPTCSDKATIDFFRQLVSIDVVTSITTHAVSG